MEITLIFEIINYKFNNAINDSLNNGSVTMIIKLKTQNKS